MVCEKCKKKIPHLISFKNGTKFQCPKCKKFVVFQKCVINQIERSK